jgi:3-methyladenine DNA glycosylase AlkD
MGTRRVTPPARRAEAPSRVAQRVLRELTRTGNAEWVAGAHDFGIHSKRMIGVSVPALRAAARSLGKDHDVAGALWETGVFEARLLAFMVDRPEEVTERQMERWVVEFDSWAICDGAAQDLFVHTPYAWSKSDEWSRRPEEYVKRTGFALVAKLAVHDKESADTRFLRFLRTIERESTDNRLYVRKAVNWALREIGKRNEPLRRAAVEAAERIHRIDSPSARWIASDALRELRSPAVRRRTRARSSSS